MSSKRLYQWQQKAVERFKDSPFFAIVADCGLGKSLAVLHIALKKKLPVIVIAPGHTLCEQWAQEIQDIDPNASVWVYRATDESADRTGYGARFAKWLIGGSDG